MHLADATGAALLTSTFWGAFTLGRLLGVPISTRLSPAKIIFVDLIGCLASVAGMILFPQSQFLLWLSTIGAGIFMASIFPTALALAGQHMTITASVTGWFLIGAGTGAMFFPWLIGQLIEPLGASILPSTIAGSLVVDGVLLMILLRVSKRK
jgi:fucose permease